MGFPRSPHCSAHRIQSAFRFYAASLARRERRFVLRVLGQRSRESWRTRSLSRHLKAVKITRAKTWTAPSLYTRSLDLLRTCIKRCPCPFWGEFSGGPQIFERVRLCLSTSLQEHFPV